MRTELREKSVLFADNRDLVAKKFIWDNRFMQVVAAVFLTSADQTVDLAKMKASLKVLKKHEGAFSVFRNNMTLPMITKMSLSEDAEAYILGVKEVYDKLHKIYKMSSEYVALAAMMIYENKDMKSVDEVIQRTESMMKAIKKEHPFITSKEDLSLISLMALVEQSEEEILKDMETCHQILLKAFSGHSNAVQTLAMVLATDTREASVKCDRVIRLYEELRRKGIKYSKGQELAVLGTCALMGEDIQSIASEIEETEEYLKTRKGFGAWGTGKNGRLMYAAMLVTESYSDDSKASNTSVAAASLAAAIAAEVAAMGAIVAATSASAASN